MLVQLDTALRTQALRSVMLHTAVAARLGIAVTDFNCLNVLSMDGPQTAGHLADRLGLTRGGAVTTMIDRLQAAGYVRRRRDETDRRRVLVELNSHVARSAIAPLFEAFGGEVSAHLDSYQNQEIKLLLGFIQRLNQMTLNAAATLRGS
jgi:DNA-binding MarR family transcriptional regulator